MHACYTLSFFPSFPSLDVKPVHHRPFYLETRCRHADSALSGLCNVNVTVYLCVCNYKAWSFPRNTEREREREKMHYTHITFMFTCSVCPFLMTCLDLTSCYRTLMADFWQHLKPSLNENPQLKCT